LADNGYQGTGTTVLSDYNYSQNENDTDNNINDGFVVEEDYSYTDSTEIIV